jgi:hypothetical protein
MRSCGGGTMAASIEPTLQAAASEPARLVACRSREVLRGIRRECALPDQALLRARVRLDDDRDVVAWSPPHDLAALLAECSERTLERLVHALHTDRGRLGLAIRSRRRRLRTPFC